VDVDRALGLAGGAAGEVQQRHVFGIGRADGVLDRRLRHQAVEVEGVGNVGRLAALADVYVNDAFGAAHRAHASTAGMVRHFDARAAGLLLAREVEVLGRILDAPEPPFLAILGGAKVSDKIAVIDSLLERVQTLCIGGAMAYTFLEARGLPIGRSLVERDRIPTATEALARAEAKVRIEDALNNMDEMDREVLTLRHFESLSNAETARVLGISDAAASNRYVRALKRLKGILDISAGTV